MSIPDSEFPDGYAVAPHWVIRNPNIPPLAKLLYVYLEGRANKDGISWPTQETVAKELGTSVPTVKRTIAWMKTNKLLIVKRKSSGTGTYNTYTVPKRLPASLTPKDQTDTLVPRDHDGGPKDHNRGDQRITQIPKEEPVRRTKEEEPLIGAVVNPFAEFWEAYPRKKGKGQAERAWKTACKKADPARLIAAAVSYRQQVQGSDMQFVKHPSTWLNGECWLDEPDPTPVSNVQGWIALAEESAYNEGYGVAPGQLEVGQSWT